jgi:hypothetical protein
LCERKQVYEELGDICSVQGDEKFHPCLVMALQKKAYRAEADFIFKPAGECRTAGFSAAAG